MYFFQEKTFTRYKSSTYRFFPYTSIFIPLNILSQHLLSFQLLPIVLPWLQSLQTFLFNFKKRYVFMKKVFLFLWFEKFRQQKLIHFAFGVTSWEILLISSSLPEFKGQIEPCSEKLRMSQWVLTTMIIQRSLYL